MTYFTQTWMFPFHFTVKYESHSILLIKWSIRLIEHITFISKLRGSEISRRNIDIIRSCTNVYETLTAVWSKVLRFPLLIAYMYSKVEQHVIRRIVWHIRSTRRFSVKNVWVCYILRHLFGSEFQIVNPISTPWMYKYDQGISSDMIITCWTHVLNE